TAWPAFDLEPHQVWYKNRTVLIGDAAHATLPYLAQGAAMALEDACVLAQLIRNSAAPETAFSEFAKRRHARTGAIQNRSRQLGKIYHAAGVMRHIRNLVLKTTPPSSFLKQVSWIYDWKI
ncbi:MAG: FAD-dependent monooxygenase, partial [Aestuariivirga sp.]